MPLTSREHTMVDFFDAGLDDGEIASRMGLRSNLVRSERARLPDGLRGDRDRDASMRQASKLLGYAIETAGGWR